jgi:hypothetical protein
MKKSLLFVLLAYSSSAFAAAYPTIVQFEKSSIFKNFSFVDKDNWKLKNGDTNYLYNFKHSNGFDYMNIEMGPSKTSVKVMSIGFPSDLDVNKIDGKEKAFILEALKYFSPKTDAKSVFKYIESQINTSYSGGSAVYPRKSFGNLKVYAGRTLSTVIGFEY